MFLDVRARFETSFRQEDHTGWKIAPSSYDLKS